MRTTVVNSIDAGKNEMIVLAFDINSNEGLKCPKCGYDYNINLDREIFDKLNNSNLQEHNILNGLKGQIANIINDINSHKETNNIINQLNNIIIMIEHIMIIIKKNSEEIFKLKNIFNGSIINKINFSIAN